MKSLYRSAPGPAFPGGVYREGIQHGFTQDGTDVAIIATRDAYYDHRKWGFDAGLWEHSFCLNQESSTLMIVSYHAASQTEKITTALTAVDWWRQVPASMRD